MNKTLISLIIICSVSACTYVSDYPDEYFFQDFKIEMQSKNNGAIMIAVPDAWLDWQRNKAKLERFKLHWGGNIKCTSSVVETHNYNSDGIIEIKFVVKDGQLVMHDVECNYPQTENELRLGLSLILEKRSFFDSSESWPFISFSIPIVDHEGATGLAERASDRQIVWPWKSGSSA